MAFVDGPRHDEHIRTPHVVKTRRKPIYQSDRTICRPQQQRAAIRRDRTPVERSHHLASFHGCKSEQI
jgi:hypothetical protein